jgi:cyclopropane fatty-acyl-phospholipid synthase-like methyltransferase
MLDVGGGSGAYAIAFAAANPDLRAEIFDLETVVPIAQSHVAQAGLTGRVGTRVGDLRRDALGSGYDLILLSAICHMLGPEENQDLFGRALAALAPGGRLVIQDFILDAQKTAPGVGALFAVNMLVGTPHGASYSEAEYAGWLGRAGFDGVRRIRLPGVTDLMIAEQR